MKRTTGLLAILLLIAVPAVSFGEDVSLERVIQALEAPFGQKGEKGGAIADFEADFRQESRLASLERTQRGRGTVAVKFGPKLGTQASLAKFRWDYEQPARQEIISDGRTLWVYLPENRQVIESQLDLSETRPDDPVTFLTGLGNLSRDFQIDWGRPNRDKDGHWVLELRPRRPSPLIDTLQVTVNKEAVSSPNAAAFPIRSTRVIDPTGNETFIEFADVRINRGLGDELFRFRIPEGVEVIRPSNQSTGF
jgi:outer membrane lipoprotein carrier protein